MLYTACFLVCFWTNWEEWVLKLEANNKKGRVILEDKILLSDMQHKLCDSMGSSDLYKLRLSIGWKQKNIRVIWFSFVFLLLNHLYFFHMVKPKNLFTETQYYYTPIICIWHICFMKSDLVRLLRTKKVTWEDNIYCLIFDMYYLQCKRFFVAKDRISKNVKHLL